MTKDLILHKIINYRVFCYTILSLKTASFKLKYWNRNMIFSNYFHFFALQIKRIIFYLIDHYRLKKNVD